MTDLERAYLHTHNAVQKLTYVLEGQGVITEHELAYIWGERAAADAVRQTDDTKDVHTPHTPKGVNSMDTLDPTARIPDASSQEVVNRHPHAGATGPDVLLGAGSPSDRAVTEEPCAHAVLTAPETRGITRENGRASDSQSGGVL
ncbi:hypothetical protein M2317_002928 [Microbacterium sp. ZKA21]|uniref:hypothetical protein n=1 Tax=Microbacterium sp. ZKA21 TaxID=3381694 RepID=UPI003D1991F6